MRKTIRSDYQESMIRRLVALRKASGLTQRELAKRLNRVPSVVAHVEMGERRVDLVELFFIAVACGSDPEKVAAQMMRDFKGLSSAEKSNVPNRKR